MYPALAGEAMTGVDPSLLYYWVDTLGDAVGGSLLFLRLPLRLLSVFAGVGLFLVVLGVYGVTTHVIRARTRELGLRLALGGTQGGIAGLLAREWSAVVGAGLAMGIRGNARSSWRSFEPSSSGRRDWTSRWPGRRLAIVFAAAGLAFFWPVRHALRIDPARALEITD